MLMSTAMYVVLTKVSPLINLFFSLMAICRSTLAEVPYPALPLKSTMHSRNNVRSTTAPLLFRWAIICNSRKSNLTHAFSDEQPTRMATKK